MGRKCRTHREVIRISRSLVGKPERKKSLASIWRKWEDDIKVDLGETGSNGTTMRLCDTSLYALMGH
jgi:hypothetical protein